MSWQKHDLTGQSSAVLTERPCPVSGTCQVSGKFMSRQAAEKRAAVMEDSSATAPAHEDYPLGEWLSRQVAPYRERIASYCERSACQAARSMEGWGTQQVGRASRATHGS